MVALEEEKRAAAAERDVLIANYKRHLEIEKEQQESKRKVRIHVVCIYTANGFDFVLCMYTTLLCEQL